MIKLTNITSNTLQTFSFTTDDNVDVTMTLRYLPTQISWVANISDVNGFNVKGVAIVASPNILREFKNIINYGIAITTTDGYDPHDLTSFSSNNAIMHILSSSDVEYVESQLYE